MFSVMVTHHLFGQPVQCSSTPILKPSSKNTRSHQDPTALPVPPSHTVFSFSSKITAAKIAKGSDEEFGETKGWAPTGSVLLAVELNPAWEQPGLDLTGDVEEVSVTC